MRKQSSTKVDLELRILGHLWQWKVSTTAALSRKFFPDVKADSSYRKLRKLRSRKLIRVINDETGKVAAWALSPAGYKFVRPYLPTLAQEGFATEHLVHDQIVTAFHLGEWLSSMPQEAAIFSEQQLRRYPPCSYPNWVPTDQTHRPDGYWLIGNRVIAVEVELSLKRECDYYKAAKFYDSQLCGGVFWVVQSESCALRILKYFKRAQLNRPEIHNFIFLNDFRENGWKARLNFGADAGKSVADVLVRNPSGERPDPDTALLLDTRKWPVDSIPSEAGQIKQNRD
jgi:hypothetical protein